MFEPEARLHLGAEAEVTAGTWLGLPAVMKQRRARGWRHPDLDERLGRQRMLAEARILLRLHRSGLPVPALLDADVDEDRLVLEHVEGRPLIEVLRDAAVTDVESLLRAVGRAVRHLHAQAVTHGDLSTNNIMIRDDGRVVLIDFGLASIEYDLERYGIDLHVLDELLGASHPDRPGAMAALEAGYLDSEHAGETEAPGGMVPSAADVLDRLSQVRSRVRYHG